MSETTGNRTAALLAAAMLRLLRDREAPKAVLAGWPEAEHGLPTSPRTLPVLRHLPLAMAYTAPETEALVAQVIADIAKLDWRQSFTAGMSEQFLANYGWTEIVGPRGPIVAERLACGFLLLGPRTAFPSHRHAAEELYLPLAGTAFWQRGRRPYAACPPGQLLHHSPWLPHAMRTADEPLLALYVWRGDELMHAPLLG